MAIPSKQIGWGTEENLLWQISKQLESLTGVTYNSKKTLLNVASGENAGAKIETYSGAWSGTNADSPFLIIDVSQVQAGIIEYGVSSGGNNGSGTIWFCTTSTGIDIIPPAAGTYSGIDFNPNYTRDGNIANFFTQICCDPVQLVYTVKLFTLPLYNA